MIFLKYRSRVSVDSVNASMWTRSSSAASLRTAWRLRGVPVRFKCAASGQLLDSVSHARLSQLLDSSENVQAASAHCRCSNEHQALIAMAASRGMFLERNVYLPLIKSLHVEGRSVAEAVREMLESGIQPSEKMWKGIDMSADEVARASLRTLKMLLSCGENQRAEALFDSMLERGVAQGVHLSIMLGTCHNSNEQRALIARYTSSGAAMTPHLYAFLLRKLISEGGALEPVLHEMDALNLVPDHQTQVMVWNALDGSDSLKDVIAAGEYERANEKFDRMLERGSAFSEHMDMMLTRVCRNSDEQLALIPRYTCTSHEHTNEMNPHLYAIILRQLISENRPLELVLHAMGELGLEPDMRIKALLESGDFAKLRAARIKALLESGLFPPPRPVPAPRPLPTLDIFPPPGHVATPMSLTTIGLFPPPRRVPTP